MTIRVHLILNALAMLLAVPLSGAITIAVAQTGKPPATMPSHQGDMKGQPGMGGMIAGPHHALAAAYRNNLATFARAVQEQAKRAKSIDLDLARPAVAEMRRSYDQMQVHHKAQMTLMSSNMTSMAGDSSKHSTSTSMMPMMQTMETHMTGLAEHLSALEAEVRISVPLPTKVSAHTAEILKHSDGLSELSGTSARTKSAAGKPTSRK